MPARSAAGGPDTGAASTQLVIAAPLLLFLLLFTIQVAVWLHAVHIAQTSAAQALAAARAHAGSVAAGQAQAAAVLTQLGTGVLNDPHVQVTRTPAGVSAQITGNAQSVVPGVHLRVRALAAGPAETWSTP